MRMILLAYPFNDFRCKCLSFHDINHTSVVYNSGGGISKKNYYGWSISYEDLVKRHNSHLLERL